MTDRKPAANVGARKLPTAPATKLRGGSVIRCRVGAEVALGAPHRPVREQFAHTVRQHPSPDG